MQTKKRRVVMRMKRSQRVQEKKVDGMWHEREVGLKRGNIISGWVYGNHLLRYKTREDREV